MGVRQYIKKALRSLYVEPLTEYINRATSEVDFGVNINNDTALKFSATYAAIRLRSENIASLPKYVKRELARGSEIAYNHPVYKLFIQPNPYTNVFDFWKIINTWLDGWGNAYAIIERDRTGNPIALHQIHPKYVSVSQQDNGKVYKVTGTKKDGVYLGENMLHFMGLSIDGILGVNPIVYNHISFGKAIATQKFGAEFYKKGGNIRGVLETDGSLSDANFSNFMKHYQDSAQNYDTPLLEYGIKYKQVGISPVAAQLLATEQYSITDIARIFNVPPHMIQDLQHATFSNIEQQTIQFAQYSLRPAVKSIEVEIENKLFFEDERGIYSVKFDLNGLMRGDLAARGQWYNTMINTGVYSRNEVRIKEGESPVEGLDTYLFPANMIIVGKENTNTNEENI